MVGRCGEELGVMGVWYEGICIYGLMLWVRYAGEVVLVQRVVCTDVFL